MEYVFCDGCERRMAAVLMTANRCKGCHEDAKRKLQVKVKELIFTDEQIEAMGNM